MRISNAVCFALLQLLPGAAARATITYTFGQSDYQLAPGQSLAVPVGLEFNGADAASLLADHGLLSAAVRVTQTSPAPGSVTLTAIMPNTTDFNDPALTPIIVGPTMTSAAFWEFADLTAASGVVGQPLDSSTQVVSLGTMTVRAGLARGQTVFSAGAYDPTLETTVLFDPPSTVLDPAILPASATFTVVPEPGSGAVAFAAVLGALTIRRRAHAGSRTNKLPTRGDRRTNVVIVNVPFTAAPL